MYEKLTLPNGVRILLEDVPYVRSAAAGIWVGNGSRNENAAENGASHFIEHMVFKGTDNYTAAELAAEMDSIGGQVNAFTTKECTCFYGHVLDTHLRRLLGILCDMLFDSVFDEKDVTNERGVICEEIDMYEDSPEDLVSEILCAGIYENSPLGRPILGTKESLSKMNGEFLREYKNRHYSPDRIVVAISGSFDKESVEYIKERFSSLPEAKAPEAEKAKHSKALIVKKKEIEQNHICMSFPGIKAADPRRYALQILSSILGGGMSSRLFQSIREKYGLCYTVYSYCSAYSDVGSLGIYTALNGESEERALEMITGELRRFAEEGITESELERAREQAKANILMGLESTSVRMSRLGKNELSFGYVKSAEEIVEAYDAVTAEAVLALARKLIDFKKLSFAAVGSVKAEDEYMSLIERLVK